MAQIIMSWSECTITIGKTGEGDVMATSLKSVGTIKDRSTTLGSAEGDKLEAKATGGKTVAAEYLDGTFQLKTRIIEPPQELFVTLGLGETASSLPTDAEEATDIKTHIVPDDYSVKVTPKNVGATGINAPKTRLMVTPGYSEEEGHYLDLTADIVYSEVTKKWYQRFKKKNDRLAVDEKAVSIKANRDTSETYDGYTINILAHKGEVRVKSKPEWLYVKIENDQIKLGTEIHSGFMVTGDLWIEDEQYSLKIQVSKIE